MKKKQLDASFVIFVLIAFSYAVFNFIWWQFNTPVIAYSISAAHFLDIFKPGWLFYNAPLITYIMRFMFFIFGKEYFDLIIIFVNYVFFLIPLYFVYKTGVEIKDKETGNIAMILFALSPAVYGLSRQYGHQDYHIIAAITFNIYSLIKSDYFKNRKWSIIYGVSAGLGLMIKDSFLAYFFMPFAYTVFLSLRDRSYKIKINNIIFAAITCALISGWHYFRPEIISKLISEPVIERAPVFSFESLRVMSIGLWEELLSPPVFIFFITGLVYFFAKYSGKNKMVILLWFLIPWAVIMFMPHSKIAEYGAGLIPAAALIGAVFINSWKFLIIKKTAILLIVLLGFFQYLDFSYGLETGLFDGKIELAGKKIRYYDLYGRLVFYDKNKSIPITDIVEHLKRNYSENTFFVESFLSVDSDAVATQMCLNDLECVQGYYDDKNLFDSDIIIISDLRFDKFSDLRTQRIYANGEILHITEEIKKEILFKTKEVFDRIKKEYKLIYIFNPFEKDISGTKIILLGKKNKFL